MKISPARVAAFDILIRVEREAAYSSALLAAHEPNLSAADRALCHELTLGTLRRQILLDRLIEVLTKGRKLDPEVRIAIRLGLYQIAFLTRIPSHSAVNESVNLVLRARKASAKAFVNGVLRNAVRSMPKLEFKDDVDRISVETSHPKWLIEKWAAVHGLDRAEKIAAANNERPTASFRIVRRGPRTELVISAARRSEWVDGCLILERSSLDAVSLAQEGAIYFQDEASQMAARSVEISPRGRFLDVCAAPGGKTTLIAMSAPVGSVIAGDLRQSRAKLLRGTCEIQVPETVKIVRYDATASLPFADGTFDSILLDAPCSGTGTIRHNPELRYRVAPDDFLRLPAEQLAMLNNASKLVKPGGTLHYSTCSLETEENEGVCKAFLAGDTSVGRKPPRVPESFVTQDGYARTFPDRDVMDGFFIATFIKS